MDLEILNFDRRDTMLAEIVAGDFAVIKGPMKDNKGKLFVVQDGRTRLVLVKLLDRVDDRVRIEPAEAQCRRTRQVRTGAAIRDAAPRAWRPCRPGRRNPV